jgi:hypothetical protein
VVKLKIKSYWIDMIFRMFYVGLWQHFYFL